MWKQLSRGGALITRKDNAPETIHERVRVYYEATQPLIEFYIKKGILHTVDGNNSMEQITKDILNKLAPISV